MKQQNTVPRLDLAPKLKRPLSLWKPVDYLRILYWVLFFPQAFQWYVDTFGGGSLSKQDNNRKSVLNFIPGNSIEKQLFIQSCLLVFVINLLVFISSGKICFSMMVYAGTVFQYISSKKFAQVSSLLVAMNLAEGLVLLVLNPTPIDFSIDFIELSKINWSPSRIFASFTIPLILLFVLILLLVISHKSPKLRDWLMPERAKNRMKENWQGNDITMLVMGGFGTGIAFGVIFNEIIESDLPLGLGLVLVLGTAFGLLLGTILFLFIPRPENWLIGSIFNQRFFENGNGFIPHVTPLPLPGLTLQLQKWLREDWETSLHNLNEILAYTMQFYSAVRAVNQVLKNTPSEQIIWRVSHLSEIINHRNIISFASVSFIKSIRAALSKRFWLFSFECYGQSFLPPVLDIRLDTPASTVTAGFWYLHVQKPQLAQEAFAHTRSLLYGEEMFTLAQILEVFQSAKEVDKINQIELLPLPSQPLLRSDSWKTIASLYRVVEDIQLVQRSVSRATRAFALNRALGELKNILDHPDSLPRTEKALILSIAQTWQESLLNLTGDIGRVNITKPVSNPYIVGDPVVGDRFMGREDIIRQLEELWVMGQQLQSVVIYGHRRMGKTSILRNATNCLGSGVKVAYVNMLEVGNAPQGIVEVLMAICDGISQVVQIPPPGNDDLFNFPLPTFRRYLQQVVEKLNVEIYHNTSDSSNSTSMGGTKGLIIALDEFEKIEELIDAGKIPADFMGFLRGLVQMNSQIAFAFAGLHTLEEMTADYFQPFFASVIPIRVGFMSRAATRQILANPDPDFPLDYTPQALDKIYHLTSGQPYLVQLIGFQLVRRYNNYVFEQGRSRNPNFTPEDVETVINDANFFRQGRYYFDGVWGQAARGVPQQQKILEVLADQPQGLSIENLVTATDIIESDLQKALKTLKRHDVVTEKDANWRIIVELFRLWLLKSA
ncbi:MAG: ATP-binding protein [Mastigocoleus sp. MO_167.B18]|nr:ATP-binding protein [Mastigocoleus sp. MO_167.B18]